MNYSHKEHPVINKDGCSCIITYFGLYQIMCATTIIVLVSIKALNIFQSY